MVDRAKYITLIGAGALLGSVTTIAFLKLLPSRYSILTLNDLYWVLEFLFISVNKSPGETANSPFSSINAVLLVL